MNIDEYRQMYQMENSHWYFVGKQKVIHAFLKHLLGDRRTRSLDVGCGTGNILTTLSEFGVAVGIDVSPIALQFCKERQLRNLALIHETAKRLPFRDAVFDLVCAVDLLEHIQDDAGLLDEIDRVTAPGGVILLIVPAHPFLWTEHDLALHHKRRYTRDQLVSLLKSRGLHLEKISYLNMLLFPVAFGYRLIKKLRRAPTDRKKARSELFVKLPPFINKFLLAIFKAEGMFLPKMNLPAGLSLLAVCRKNQAVTES